LVDVVEVRPSDWFIHKHCRVVWFDSIMVEVPSNVEVHGAGMYEAVLFGVTCSCWWFLSFLEILVLLDHQRYLPFPLL
jgi:hypothetical protein